MSGEDEDYGFGNPEGEEDFDDLDADALNVNRDEDDITLFNNNQEAGDRDSDSENNSEEEYDSDEEDKVLTKEDKRVVPDDKRTTDPIITQYELARIKGVRAQQIANGSPVIPPVTEMIHLTNEFDIVEQEILHKVIPIKIRRERPDGMIEIWSLHELHFPRT